tara:strand:- start:273 stop:1040 length:768 start_codon:yes stop_codon:yes gene_type:complete
MKKPVIEKLYFSPVKSLSFSSSLKLEVKKNIGIVNDRIFAFTRLINRSLAYNYEKNIKKRNLNFFLTLKNSPFLNKYNFTYNENKKELTLFLKKKLIITISTNSKNNYKLLEKELANREKITSYKPYLLSNIKNPFFDTMPHNSISLINMNSIKDFSKKINFKINHERFRGNIYIKNLEAWSEFDWINKKILINKCLFKVLSKIDRCSATNLATDSVKADINLPTILRKVYGHINMGIYLKPLNNGKIFVKNLIK